MIFLRGAPTSKVGVLTYFIGRKLHDNERIWTPEGTRPCPLRSATASLAMVALSIYIGFYLQCPLLSQQCLVESSSLANWDAIFVDNF